MVTLFCWRILAGLPIAIRGCIGVNMENSHKYFENKDCQYYPCHQGTQNLNCMFCYCPLYSREKCSGNYVYIDSNGKRIKECTNCTFPHKAENYEIIMELLSKQ